MFTIDHLGIAVKSLAVAKAIYEKLGLSVSPEETVEQEKVRLVMVPVGESRTVTLPVTITRNLALTGPVRGSRSLFGAMIAARKSAAVFTFA